MLASSNSQLQFTGHCLRFLSTHVQGMYTPVRIMHFFSYVRRNGKALGLYQLVRIWLESLGEEML